MGHRPSPVASKLDRRPGLFGGIPSSLYCADPTRGEDDGRRVRRGVPQVRGEDRAGGAEDREIERQIEKQQYYAISFSECLISPNRRGCRSSVRSSPVLSVNQAEPPVTTQGRIHMVKPYQKLHERVCEKESRGLQPSLGRIIHGRREDQTKTKDHSQIKLVTK